MTMKSSDLAREFLEKIGRHAPISEIVDLLSDDVVFEIPGDTKAFPWIGTNVGRQAFADFIRDHREMVRADAFRVDDILSNPKRTVILGELKSTVRRTGKIVESYFTIILTNSNGKISRFQMMEDSYVVSLAAH